MRTRRKPGRWSGNYPPRSPAEWIDEKHVTCSIRCLNGDCRRMVDVRLDTLATRIPRRNPLARRASAGHTTPVTYVTGLPKKEAELPEWRSSTAARRCSRGSASCGR